VTFAGRMDVKLIAEGIETTGQLAKLLELGVEFGQGFLFAQPCEPFPADEVVRANL
jgi:EAL domain-containing protein (putative c-di-GMP-specific phosphodiesterase class I)